MKCTKCKKNPGKHKPKGSWDFSGLLCADCYDSLYKDDPDSIINNPNYKKFRKFTKTKYWIAIGAVLLIIGILLA